MKFKTLMLMAVMALSILGAGSKAFAEPLDIWHWRNPSPPGNDLKGVAYAQGKFIAVGDEGTLLTSSDGVKWMERETGTDYGLNAVAYGNGTFVVVGNLGTILTSTTGKVWVERTSPTFDDPRGVAWGNKTFVAVGERGTVLTSADGIKWVERDSGTTWDLNAVSYGNQTFVAAGEASTTLYSRDGTKWQPGSLHDTVLGLGFGGGTFVAVGWGGRENGRLFTSPDGDEWQARVSGTIRELYGVCWGKNTFVAVGDRGTILQSDPSGAGSET
jgi:hypothetical protein